MVQNVEHDDYDGDSDEVRHEMARCLHITAGQPSRRYQWLLFSCTEASTAAITPYTRQMDAYTVRRYITATLKI